MRGFRGRVREGPIIKSNLLLLYFFIRLMGKGKAVGLWRYWDVKGEALQEVSGEGRRG